MYVLLLCCGVLIYQQLKNVIVDRYRFTQVVKDNHRLSLAYIFSDGLNYYL